MARAKDNDSQYPFLFDVADGPSAVKSAVDASGIKIPDSATRPKRQVNATFLRNVLSQAEGHNAVLLKRERDERIGMRRHPLIDKIKAVEREKLERTRREREERIAGRKVARNRSRSPRKGHRRGAKRHEDSGVREKDDDEVRDESQTEVCDESKAWKCGAGYL